MPVEYLVGFIIIIAIVCALIPIPEKFQNLLYIICAILLIMAVASYFLGFPGGHAVVVR